jgi:hypothetical protein
VALAILVSSLPGQAIAAVFAIRAGDVVTGAFCGVLAMSWASIGAILLAAPPGSASDTLGTLLLVTGTALLLSAASSATIKPLHAAVVGTASGLRQPRPAEDHDPRAVRRGRRSPDDAWEPMPRGQRSAEALQPIVRRMPGAMPKRRPWLRGLSSVMSLLYSADSL